jgi:putative transposase
MKPILLNFKHRLHPSPSQVKLFDAQIFAANQVFNITLSHLQQELKLFNTFAFAGLTTHKLSDAQLDRKINSILKSRSIYGELDTRQQERNIAKRAFWDAFKTDKGFARFRRSNSLSGAFSGVNARTTFGSNWVKLSKRMGKIKMTRERPFPENSKVKAVRIKKELGKFYIIVTLQLVQKGLTKSDIPSIPTPITTLGMDTNNGSVDFSDGTKIKYERNLNEKELLRLRKIGKGKKTKKQKRITKLLNEYKFIKKLERKQSKRIEKAKKTKIKLGKNYDKDKLKLGKLKNRRKNRRKNILDKLSNEILSKAFDVLFIENLNIKKMIEKPKSERMNNKSMRVNILDYAYAELHFKLEYKAMHIDRLVLEVDPRYTSQECSNCGNRRKLKLSERKYICYECGMEKGRDHNAAVNIDNRGIKDINNFNPSREAA